MNKLFTKIAALALGAAMAFGVGVAVSSKEKAVEETHALTASDISTTPATTIENGAKYVIASGTSGNVYLAAKASNTWGTAVAIGSAYEFTAEGSGTSGFYLKCTDGYLVPKTSSSNTFLAYASSKATAQQLQLKNSTELFSNANAHYNLRQNGTSGYRWYGTTTDGTTGTAAKLYKVNAGVAVTGVSVSPTSTSIGVGGSATLTATISPSDATDKAVTWSSSKPSVATVSNGTVTALSAGETTITVTTHDGGFAATCAVTVTAPIAVTGVSLNKSSTSIESGSTETLVATVSPSDASNKNVNWTSSNNSVATVSGGVVTAVSKGSATITATTADGGFTDTCDVTVTMPTSVTFTYGTDNSTGSTMTKSGTTLTIGTPGTDGTFDVNNNNCYKIYKGKTLVVSSSTKIAKVEFTCTTQGTSQYGPGCFDANVGSYAYSGYNGTWTGSATSITFTASSNQTRPTEITITYENTDPSVMLDASSATSVTMLKGDPDTSVKVLVKNITSLTWSYTYDEDEVTGKTTSAYINVSASALVSDIATLTITTKAIGSTTLHISVSGTSCPTAIPVTVNAKPASMMVTESNHETEITTLELQSGGSTKQVYWIGEDTDGHSYSIAAAQVDGQIISGSNYVSISSGAGTVITPVAQGTAVIRYSLKVLSSVYAEITVNVVDDYKTTVNSITFNGNLSDTQGDAVDTSAVFATKVANTHFGTTETITDSELLFSYENNRSGAEAIGVFSYDFSHGTTVDTTHKSQTIYVFTTFDEAYNGSFTITIEQKNDPLTAITITNVVNNEKEMARGTSFQLEIAYTPTNPTDGKEVVYRVDDNDDELTISVSASGLIEIGSASNLGTALIVVESAHNATIHDYVYVTATLESMTYIVSEEESLTPVSTVSAGDRVYMVATATDHSNQTYEFNGFPGTYGGATQYTTNIAKLQLLIVEAGSSSGTVSFKVSGGDQDGEYLSYSGSSNTLNHTATKDATSSWTVNGSTITNSNTSARQMWLNWNNGTPRFACYTNKEDTTGYYCPTFIKVTGGDVEYTVTETLFNGVRNNFGTGKTYEWDATCSEFDEDAWLDACEALTEITSYSSYKLNRAVANESGNEVEVFLAKYDSIVRKFGDTHDHLDRFAVGGINHGSVTKVNPLSLLTNNSGTEVAIIVVTSMIGLSAVGGYFFLRKRKENI